MSNQTGRYEISIVGRLAPRWAAYFEGMTVTGHDDGTTVLSGPVTDQSALHGLIRRLSDLGLPLVSIRPATDEHPTERPTEGTSDPADPSPARPHPRSTP